MSLQVEGHRRGRSRSPGGRERDRSRSRGPPLVVDVNPQYDERDRDRYYDYEDRRSSYKSPTSPNDDYHRRPRSPAVENGARTSYGDVREREHRRDSPRDKNSSDSDRDREREREKAKTGLGLMDAFLPQKYAKKLEESDAYNLMTAPLSDRSRERSRDRRAEKKEKLEEDLAYGKLPTPASSAKDARPVSPRPLSPISPTYEYASMPPYQQYQYQQQHGRPEERGPEDRYAYPASPRHSPDKLDVVGGNSSSSRHGRGRSRSKSPAPRHSSRDNRKHGHSNSLTADPRGSTASLGAGDQQQAAGGDGAGGPRKSALKRTSSPQPPVNRMSSLSVNTAYNANSLGGGVGGVGAAPPSPLLESYHGTYQSMSPMPSPLLMPSAGAFGGADVLDASPLGSDDERSYLGSAAGDKKRSRRARFADPEDDAQRLADALHGRGPPRTEPIVEILPGLTHEQIMDLRAEYKRLVKTGPEKKGVNVAKHIRARLKDEDPSLMKACYATALGRWESEAYWSSFWYQGDKTRRELLIESLMGRSNDEVRRIKEAFSDKTYDDSLVRCMRHELKEDKFKKAVLAVLDEQRMEDVDRHGRPLPIDWELVKDDIYHLHKAVKAEKGGESAMISIVVHRSDSHLREVLRAYNEEYSSNFAREALRKSGNLVVCFIPEQLTTHHPPLPSFLHFSTVSYVLTPLPRANSSHTSSTALLISPSAMRSSCTTRSRPPRRTLCGGSS